jgi:hypothetical protein
MLPRLAISSIDKTQGAALEARLWFFGNKNDSAVLIFKKVAGNLVQIRAAGRTILPKTTEKYDSNDKTYVYNKRNDSAVYKITH